MTKLYYDDALVAAYMAKQFQVKYKEYLKDVNDMRDVCQLLQIDAACMGGDTWLSVETPDIYHIDPNSYDIFKPQVGDLVEAHGFEEYNSKFGLIKEIKHNVWIVSDDFECGSKTVTIIQRNGKAFFMPKSEE